MADIPQPAVVDASGNIVVHGRAGLVLVIKMYAPGTDEYKNIATDLLYFEVSGRYRVALAAGADVYSRQVELSRDQVDELAVGIEAQFALVDETATLPLVPWSGGIGAFGFRAQPPGAIAPEGSAIPVAGGTVIIASQGTTTPVVVLRYEAPAFAAGVSYDNSYSGLAATNVQAAIDELAGPAVSTGQLDFSIRANSGLLAVI